MMKCEWCKITLPIAVIVLIIGFFSYQFIDPAPPKTLKIATGKADGSYYISGGLDLKSTSGTRYFMK